MDRMSASDLTAVGITDSQELSDLTEFRQAVSTLVAAYEANKTAIKKLNRMMIF